MGEEEGDDDDDDDDDNDARSVTVERKNACYDMIAATAISAISTVSTASTTIIIVHRQPLACVLYFQSRSNGKMQSRAASTVPERVEVMIIH